MAGQMPARCFLARLHTVEFGFRFEVWFWVRPGATPGAPGSVFGFQRARAEGTRCQTSRKGCLERRSTRCKRSTAATGTPLTRCLRAFVFSVDWEVRDVSPPARRRWPHLFVVLGLSPPQALK